METTRSGVEYLVAAVSTLTAAFFLVFQVDG
jgi:hypothetical protein